MRGSNSTRLSQHPRTLLHDRRGAVFVEHLLMVSIGLLVAALLVAAGQLLFTRCLTITTGLYLGVP